MRRISLNSLVLFSTCLIIIPPASCGFLEDFLTYFNFKDLMGDNNKAIQAEGDLPKIPFELTPHETIFLEEALSLSGQQSPSNLDRCQQRVVLKLRKQCRQINDEELGKLSVMLLNCLRQTEGRSLVECSDTMSLSECLSHADPEAYNSYQQMSTRAKAVCIAVRQEQYRAWTENAVNKLTDYAQEQMMTSGMLNEAQRNLLEMINKSSNNFIGKETEILGLMDSIRVKYMTNVREIIQEHGLILEQHKQKIALSMEEFSEFSSQISSTNTLINSDLLQLHEKMMKMVQEIGDTNEELLKQIETIFSQYSKTLGQLQDIESSVGKLLNITNDWHGKITNSSQWIEEVFGEVSAPRIFLHGVILFTGMIILSFLQVDSLSRIIFTTFTIGHALIDLYTEYGLSLPALLGSLVCLIGGKYAVFEVNWRELLYVKVEAADDERERRSSSRSLFTCTAYNSQGARCSKPCTDGIYCQDHHYLSRKHGR